METYIVKTIEYILTTYFMIALWSAVVGVSVFTAYKTKAYGILILSGGAVPFVIFYVYKLLNVWETSPHAVLYSRVAMVSLCVSIILSLWLMCRSMCDGPNHTNDL